MAIRDNPIAARGDGRSTPRSTSRSTFGVSAAYTGVAGALSALAIAFVAPDAFNVFLSITFLVGIVVGGLASVSGAVFGAFFIQFVPNWAQDISKAAPWAIYGVFLIVFMYVMPSASPARAAALGSRIGRRARAAEPAAAPVSVLRDSETIRAPPFRHSPEEAPMSARRWTFALPCSPLRRPPCRLRPDAVGVTATEIKIGNTNPYSGPASAYGTIGKVITAYFKKVNDEGGINGRKINFITYDDAYSPPKTVEMVRRLVEQDQVAFVFKTLGTPTNSAIHKYMNQQKVPHLFVATGATKWGDPKNFPWTMGWQPNYQTEGQIYAQYVLKNVKDAKIGILYQNDDYGKDYLKGFKDGLGDAGQEAHRHPSRLRGHGSHHRLADREPQEQRRQRLLQHHHPEVRRAGDQEGARHRLEAPAPAQQRVGSVGVVMKPAGARGVEGHHHRAST